MADLEGSYSLEIDAPLERVFDIAADVAAAPRWQGPMKAAEVLEQDAEGRASLVRVELDASVTQHTMVLRFNYSPPTLVTWERESGDLKSLEGRWELEDIGGNRTRATYALEIGLSRALALMVKTVRGPARERVEHLLTHRPVEGLKAEAEG